MTTETVEPAPAPPLERLIRFCIIDDAFVFVVASQDCTAKTAIRVGVVRAKAASYVLELSRSRPDMCKGFFPQGTRITFGRRELGLPDTAPVTVRNMVDNAGHSGSPPEQGRC